MSVKISVGYSFGATELVTNTKLHSLVDDATVDMTAPSAIGSTTPSTGAFTTLSATGDIYTNAWADYFATSTIVGWAASPTGSIYTKKIGKTVLVSFYLSGVSNAITATFTLPYANNSVLNISSLLTYTRDNGVVLTTPGRLYILPTALIVNCFSNTASAVWVDSGTKSVRGQFFYECA